MSPALRGQERSSTNVSFEASRFTPWLMAVPGEGAKQIASERETQDSTAFCGTGRPR